VSRPLCVVIGAGRLAGGFLAPLLNSAGWDVVLSGRDPAVVSGINARGGFCVRLVGERPHDRWIDRAHAIDLEQAQLASLIGRADMVATAVGPSALGAIGRLLGPLLAARFSASKRPLNIIAFENHRRAAELLASGILEVQPTLARHIGTQLGIAGSAVWCVASRREVSEQGVRYDADQVVECYADRASLIGRVAPLDGSVPGISLVQPFEWRIVEKLWVFNAGHAAAAYIGWREGCTTLHEAMARPRIRAAVAAVVEQAQHVFQVTHPAQRGAAAVPSRSVASILERYADPWLGDSVARVAREPRRKLASGDRLLGPAVACVGAGIEPVALANAAAAALAYADPSDAQALDLQRELALLGPEEVLATLGMLDPGEELTRLIAEMYRSQVPLGAGR
jgi:mannitol-1-phosphate 5-dehydrogenase